MMSPEVLIYVQTVKNYLKNNIDARDYFIGDANEKLFFEHLSKISQKNYEKNGEVTLTKDQFELLRKTIKVIGIANGIVEINPNNLFFNVPGYGQFSLN